VFAVNKTKIAGFVMFALHFLHFIAKNYQNAILMQLMPVNENSKGDF
jgi:hypothetical protein